MIHLGCIAASGCNRLVRLVARDHRTMMLTVKIINTSLQAVFAGESHNIIKGLITALCAFNWIELIMLVHTSWYLVFNKVYWVQRFSYIMEERPHTGEQRICADKLRGLLSQVGHLQTVLVRTGRIA